MLEKTWHGIDIYISLEKSQVLFPHLTLETFRIMMNSNSLSQFSFCFKPDMKCLTNLVQFIPAKFFLHFFRTIIYPIFFKKNKKNKNNYQT